MNSQKVTKKALSALLASTLVFSLLPTAAFAAQADTSSSQQKTEQVKTQTDKQDKSDKKDKEQGAELKDIEEKEKSDPGFANLSEAAELISVINQNYSDYTKDLSHSKINVNKAAEKLTEIYGETPEIFDIPDLDEAFVKALVMTDDMDTLIDYATSTESQVALVTVAQLLVDGHISQNDLPKDFVEISTNVKFQQ